MADGGQDSQLSDIRLMMKERFQMQKAQNTPSEPAPSASPRAGVIDVEKEFGVSLDIPPPKPSETPQPKAKPIPAADAGLLDLEREFGISLDTDMAVKVPALPDLEKEFGILLDEETTTSSLSVSIPASSNRKKKKKSKSKGAPEYGEDRKKKPPVDEALSMSTPQSTAALGGANPAAEKKVRFFEDDDSVVSTCTTKSSATNASKRAATLSTLDIEKEFGVMLDDAPAIPGADLHSLLAELGPGAAVSTTQDTPSKFRASGGFGESKSDSSSKKKKKKKGSKLGATRSEPVKNSIFSEFGLDEDDLPPTTAPITLDGMGLDNPPASALLDKFGLTVEEMEQFDKHSTLSPDTAASTRLAGEFAELGIDPAQLVRPPSNIATMASIVDDPFLADELRELQLNGGGAGGGGGGGGGGAFGGLQMRTGGGTATLILPPQPDLWLPLDSLVMEDEEVNIDRRHMEENRRADLMEKKVKLLQHHLNEMEEELEDAQEEVSTVARRNRSLEDQVNALKNIIEDMELNHEEQIMLFGKEKEQLIEELSQTNQSHQDALRTELALQVSRMQDTLGKMEAQKIMFQKENEELDMKVHRLEVSLAEEKRMKDMIKKEKKALKKSLAELKEVGDSEKEVLRQQVAIKIDEMAEMSRKNKFLMDRNAALERNLMAEQEKVIILESKLLKKEQQIQQLLQSLAAADKAAAEMKESHRTLKRNIKALNDRLKKEEENVAAAVAAARESSQALDAERVAYTNQLINLKAKMEEDEHNYMAQIKKWQSAKKRLESQVLEIQRENKSGDEARKHLGRLNKTLSKEVSRLRAAMNLQGQVDDSISQAQRLIKDGSSSDDEDGEGPDGAGDDGSVGDIKKGSSQGAIKIRSKDEDSSSLKSAKRSPSLPTSKSEVFKRGVFRQ